MLLSVLKDPIARMRRFARIEQRQKGSKAVSMKGTVRHSDVSASSAIIKDGILPRKLKSGRVKSQFKLYTVLPVTDATQWMGCESCVWFVCFLRLNLFWCWGIF